MNERYGPATDEKFLAKVEPWIAQYGEVFVRFTLPHAGGSNGCAFCESLFSLRGLIQNLPSGTRVSVFRGRRLPYRGVADEQFCTNTLGNLEDGADFLLVRFEPQPYSIALSCYAGSSHRELQEWLQDYFGERVAVGEEPVFTGEGDEAVITATKDGVVSSY